MNNHHSKNSSNHSYDERFYTPRAQAASSRSTSSFETPRSSLNTGRSRESSSNDSYYTPRNIIDSGRSFMSSHSENMNIHPHLHTDVRRLPPQRPNYQMPNQRLPIHRPCGPLKQNIPNHQYSYQGDIESNFSNISMNQKSDSIPNLRKSSENIFSLARHSRAEDVDRLLIEGIDVNLGDENGNTILCIACQNGNKRMAKLALRWGCDINAQNMKGNTPIHFCYQYGYRSLGEYLISKGADPTILNSEGLTCFDLSEISG